MKFNLQLAGALLVMLSLLHIVFPRYFKWDKEFAQVSPINRQMMYIHAFFISLVVLMMGILCLTSAGELMHTKLGNDIALGLGIFWLIRLLFQFFGYSTLHWKGKRKETCIHVLFSVLWIYLCIVFFAVYLLH
jgi:hypothetical protein